MRAKGGCGVRLRTTLLAVGAVFVVAAASAAVTLIVLQNPASGTAEGSAESTRTLDTAVYTLPAFDTASPSGTLPAPQPQPRAATPVARGKFDANAAMAHVRALEALGPRLGGGAAEGQAAIYIRDRLAALGIDARIEEFPLPNGTTSRNVVARVKGSSATVLVLGAHMDTKPPSPGANDNASGCGALLAIAAVLAEEPVAPTVEFVFFGSEETNGGDPNGHHYGSRYRVAQMSAAERANTAGMISVDMIGYGPGFHSRTMGRGPETLSDMLLAHASGMGIPMTYLKDPGKSGWSDHEAYELAGLPVSWIEWRDDPVYHTAGDTASHVSTAKVATAGKLVLDFTQSLDGTELATLLAR